MSPKITYFLLYRSLAQHFRFKTVVRYLNWVPLHPYSKWTKYAFRTLPIHTTYNVLVSFEQGNPAWKESVYGDFAEYPSVKWKLLNLNKLKKANPRKLEKEAKLLDNILSS